MSSRFSFLHLPRSELAVGIGLTFCRASLSLPATTWEANLALVWLASALRRLDTTLTFMLSTSCLDPF